jgi:hypothetical protein
MRSSKGFTSTTNSHEGQESQSDLEAKGACSLPLARASMSSWRRRLRISQQQAKKGKKEEERASLHHDSACINVSSRARALFFSEALSTCRLRGARGAEKVEKKKPVSRSVSSTSPLSPYHAIIIIASSSPTRAHRTQRRVDRCMLEAGYVPPTPFGAHLPPSSLHTQTCRGQAIDRSLIGQQRSGAWTKDHRRSFPCELLGRERLLWPVGLAFLDRRGEPSCLTHEIPGLTVDRQGAPLLPPLPLAVDSFRVQGVPHPHPG